MCNLNIYEVLINTKQDNGYKVSSMYWRYNGHNLSLALSLSQLFLFYEIST